MIPQISLDGTTDTALAAADLDTVTLFENVDITTNLAAGIVSDTLMIATGGSMNWTASGMTTAAVTLDVLMRLTRQVRRLSPSVVLVRTS